MANYLFYAVILLLLTLAGWLYLSTTVRVDALAVDIYRLELEKEELRREIVQRGPGWPSSSLCSACAARPSVSAFGRAPKTSSCRCRGASLWRRQARARGWPANPPVCGSV